jgi:hypothetical protein
VNRRCLSIYPGAETLLGKPIRCDQGSVGHDGRHGNGFAARYWEVGAHSCALCGVESLTDETSPCRFERGCSCWRGIPCRKPTPIAV